MLGHAMLSIVPLDVPIVPLGMMLCFLTEL